MDPSLGEEGENPMDLLSKLNTVPKDRANHTAWDQDGTQHFYNITEVKRFYETELDEYWQSYLDAELESAEPPQLIYIGPYNTHFSRLSKGFVSVNLMIKAYKAKKTDEREDINYVPWGHKLYPVFDSHHGSIIPRRFLDIFYRYYSDCFNALREVNGAGEYELRTDWYKIGLPALNEKSPRSKECIRPFIDLDIKERDWALFLAKTDDRYTLDDLHQCVIDSGKQWLERQCGEDQTVEYVVAKSTTKHRNIHVIYHVCFTVAEVSSFHKGVVKLVTQQMEGVQQSLVETIIDINPLKQRQLRPICSAKTDQPATAAIPSIYIPNDLDEKEITPQHFHDYSIRCPCEFSNTKPITIGYLRHELNTSASSYEQNTQSTDQAEIVENEMNRLMQSFLQNHPDVNPANVVVKSSELRMLRNISDRGGLHWRFISGSLPCPFGQVHETNRRFIDVTNQGAVIRCFSTNCKGKSWPTKPVPSEELVKFIGKHNSQKRKRQDDPEHQRRVLSALSRKDEGDEKAWAQLGLSWEDRDIEGFFNMFRETPNGIIQPITIEKFCKKYFHNLYKVHGKEGRVYKMSRENHLYYGVDGPVTVCDYVIRFYIHNLVANHWDLLLEEPLMIDYLQNYRTHAISQALRTADKQLSQICKGNQLEEDYEQFETVKDRNRNILSIYCKGILDFEHLVPWRQDVGKEKPRMKPSFRPIQPTDYVTMAADIDELIEIDAELTPEQQRKIDWVHERFMEFACGDEDWKRTLLDRVASALDVARGGEPVINVMIGGGSNGKTWFQKFVQTVFSTTCKVVHSSLLTSGSSHPGAASPHIIDLNHVRHWFLSEPDTKTANNKNMSLNDAMLKKIAGGDVISARNLYQGEQIEVQVDGIGWMLCNSFPDVQATDNGVWRRLLFFDCKARFAVAEEYDKHRGEMGFYPIIPNMESLYKEYTGAFFYIIMQHWFECFAQEPRRPIKIAQSCKDTTRKEMEKNNPLFVFTREHLTRTDHPTTLTVSEIYEVYKNWFDAFTGEKTNANPVGEDAFMRDLQMPEKMVKVTRDEQTGNPKVQVTAYWKESSKYHPNSQDTMCGALC